MYRKLFIEGFCLGFTIAIPIKYGVSLDPIYYRTLVLTTISNATTNVSNNSNSLFDLDSFISRLIIILGLIGIVISVVGIYDIYTEIQDEPLNKLSVYGFGFLVGLILVFRL